MRRSIALAVLVLATGLGPAAAADGNAQAGGVIFTAQCGACHRIGPDAANALGPMLNGVVGRKSGSVANYNYSDANKGSGITWDEATLVKYLKSPVAVVPGTKMIFAGLKTDQEIADVVAYLKGFGPDGKPPAK